MTELGDDVTPQVIDFQASAYSAVDDLVVTGHSEDGNPRRVSVGVRRDPSFVPSDRASVELLGSYLRVVHDHPSAVAEGRWRLALVVASPNAHVRQLRELAALARDTDSESRFRAEATRAGRTNREVRERLRQFDTVVALAAARSGVDTGRVPASELTWLVLGALRLREVRLEGVDETDRSIAVGRLRGVVGAGTTEAADRLFSRLCELVGRYAPVAASKSINSLRRDLIGHSLTGQSSQASDAENVDGSTTKGPVVRSAYLSQVRRIAPEALLSRENELADLARFATEPDSEPYLWLRAQAWAGKSALLSSFVLAPPPGVRVVSFFVTARWAGQADRTAFIEVALEQVLEILGEPMPMLLTDATREAHLLAAFERAADLCRRKGERLLLVVDGLDEDSGVTTAVDTHSIAAVLPINPPTGMRVVVAGRPNPPIPSDVPDSHPLRWPGIVRPLLVSPHAEVVRQDAERELKRLLRGSVIERDLLGLLVAAGGGLSQADLAQLTGVSAWEIEDHLRSVSARTFTSRSGRFEPRVTVYVLGHEEIHQQAMRFLGEDRLFEYRERIHEWADLYRSAKWPSGTPEYLLRGYFKLLHSTRDTRRMLNIVTDPDRHFRMLDTIGGDSVAISEISATQETISSAPAPDLVALSRLAVHRIKLIERNDNLPTHLPVVWAQLDRHSRAEALARSITTPARQVRALASVARHVASVGDLQRARMIAEEAERSILAFAATDAEAHSYALVARTYASAGDMGRAQLIASHAAAVARSMPDRPQAAHVLCSVARATAAAGDVEQALATARGIKRWSERAQALCNIAVEVAESGDWKRAHSIARSIRPRAERAQALAVVARAAKAAGACRRAEGIVAQAEALALSIRNPGRRAWILAVVARELVDIEGEERAREVLREAERTAALAEVRPAERRDALTSIAGVLARAGATDRAEGLARRFSSLRRRARALAVVASSLAANGEFQRAEAIASEAENMARALDGGESIARNQAVLAQVIASTGDITQALEIARAITDVPRRERALTMVAEATALAGDLARAEEVVASIADMDQKSKALLILVRAGAGQDLMEEATRIACSIVDEECRDRALALLSRKEQQARGASEEEYPEVVVPRNDSQPAERTKPSRAVLTIPRSSSNHFKQAQEVISRAQDALRGGDVDQARQIVESIEVPALRVKGLMSLSIALAGTSDECSAGAFRNQALAVIDSLPNPEHQAKLINGIAQQLAVSGDVKRAERLANSIAIPPLRQKALGAVASAAAQSGGVALSERIARTISDSVVKAKALASIAQNAAGVGALDEAERIARSIANPIPRSRALGVVARAWAASGEPRHAEAVASEISDLVERSMTLTSLAADFKAESPAQLLAQALVIGHWSVSLRALMCSEPEVVSAIGTEFLRANSQEIGTVQGPWATEREDMSGA
ncbi:ATP-binding protein [Streptomyces albospinus]|nr:ATP-binding protein [Streptomyces albospinus]